MKEYPLEKYRFVINEDKQQIIAITNDAGETIKASASCSPNDTFDVNYGKQLAAVRANYKVALRRKKRAEKAVYAAQQEVIAAMARLESARAFEKDAGATLNNAITAFDQYDF